ncbi:MAG: RDD family protein [Saprospiraceae bacterium]|nr:RDD family protein [Saprospiraceae bacterium]
MKKIEVITAQNVKVEYTLAPFIERALAFFIDEVIIWLSSLILFLFSKIFTSNEMAFWIIFVPIFTLYSLMFESLNNGQSPGKLFLKIKVVKINGEKADVFDYMMRWAFRMIDIFLSFGTLATLLIISSSKSQRIGDFLAETSVIKVLGGRRVKLEKILNLNKQINYQPTYPAVTKLTENEVLLIKETLDRLNKNNTEGHIKAIESLSKKIQEQLNISAHKDKKVFLSTIIKDYVFLTR